MLGLVGKAPVVPLMDRPGKEPPSRALFSATSICSRR